jgi:hypothetical protein
MTELFLRRYSGELKEILKALSSICRCTNIASSTAAPNASVKMLVIKTIPSPNSSSRLSIVSV